MRIVIAGAGEVGYHLAMSLAPNHDVIIIEKDLSRFERVSELDVVAIYGNAANMKVLKDAGVERADVFLAVTGNDEVNLLSGLAAKKAGTKNVIVRVENPEYVDRPIVRDHPLGYDVLICPQLSLAQEAARLIGIPGAIEVVTFSGGRVEMIELQVMEGSKADGRAIADLYLPQNVVIASIYRNGHIENTPGRYSFEGWGQGGDRRQNRGCGDVEGNLRTSGNEKGNNLWCGDDWQLHSQNPR